MEIEKIEELYKEIAEHFNVMIPIKWSKLYLYFRIEPGVSEMFYYFYPKNEKEPVFSSDIPKLYNLDDDEFTYLDSDLDDLCTELHDEFDESDQKKWTNFTFYLESDGTFKIDYNYDECSFSNSIERKVLWKKKYLGL